MHDHPIIKWFGLVLAVGSGLTAVGSVWWYLQDQKLRDEEWLRNDIVWNGNQISKLESIIGRQAEITEELATQTLRLAEIENQIIRHWDQREQRFEEIESEHKLVLQAIYSMGADIREAIGRHEGHHDYLP